MPGVRRRRLVFAVLVTLLVVGIGVFGIWRWNESQKLNHALEEMRSGEYPVTFVDLDAWYETPPGDNAADLYLKAFDLIVMRRRDSSEEALAANQKALEILHEAAGIEAARYPVNFALGVPTDSSMPHLDHIGDAAYLLRIEALARGENGDAAGAAESLIAQAALVQSLSAEPVLISRMIYVASMGRFVETAAEILNLVPLDAISLDRLDRQVARMENSDYMYRALAGERFIGLTGLQAQQASGAGNRIGAVLGIQDRINAGYLESMNSAIAVALTPYPDRLVEFEKLSEKSANVGYFDVYSRIMLPNLVRSLMSDIEAKSRVAALRMAVGVLRFEAKYGRLPESADELAPEFFETLPIDPCSGEPIQLWIGNGEFVASSVGLDGVSGVGGVPEALVIDGDDQVVHIVLPKGGE